MEINKKIILSSAVLFLLATGCNQAVQLKQDSGVNEGNLEQVKNTPAATTTADFVEPDGQAQNIQNAGEQNYQPSNPDGPISNIPKLTVTQTVEGSNVNLPSYSVGEGITALALLKDSHKIETKSYGDMGEFVESIDGIKPDSKHFWEFFVNGKSSNVGAGSYRMQDGDKIEWKLSKIGS